MNSSKMHEGKFEDSVLSNYDLANIGKKTAQLIQRLLSQKPCKTKSDAAKLSTNDITYKEHLSFG